MRPLISVLAILLSSAAAHARDITVAADGSGDFKTVTEAIGAVPAGNTERVVLTLRPGTYKERIKIGRDKPFITVHGEDAKATVLTWNWNAKTIDPEAPEFTPATTGTEPIPPTKPSALGRKEVGTSGSYSVRIEADDFTAENITFENTAGDTGQALALYASGDRQIYRHCRFIGWQDTIYAGVGRQYYADSYIEGRVDFIFGHATAVFDKCEIHSKNGGYVTAADTPKDQPFGYVFLDCKLTGDGKPALLGRPWRPYAAVAFIRCDLGAHIDPVGWNNWRSADNEKTARYSEFNCTGPGADRTNRVPWSKELTAEEAKAYTVQNLFAGEDGWNPAEK